jgi:hypothetical protein
VFIKNRAKGNDADVIQKLIEAISTSSLTFPYFHDRVLCNIEYSINYDLLGGKEA